MLLCWSDYQNRKEMIVEVEKQKISGFKIEGHETYYIDLLKEEVYFEYLFRKFQKLGEKTHLSLTGIVNLLKEKISFYGLLKLHDKVDHSRL